MCRALSATILAAFALAGAAGCAAKARPQTSPQPPSRSPSGIETIGELKAFESTLGGHETENFLRYSPRLTSDDRCYFTGKLELPQFYSGLKLVREAEAPCMARASISDVFFYPVQAVASGEETITVGLAEAPVERVLVVVPHEDFHNQAEALKVPTEIAESAATLVGFLTASAFAREKFGDASPTFRGLERDADIFFQKSLIVNLYYDKLTELYGSFRSGALTEAQTLDRKTELFGDLQRDCSAITPDPVSFNKCPAAMNNAGLAFDRTYTRNYPALHDLYVRLGRNTATVVPTLKGLMAQWPSGQRIDASEILERLINGRIGTAGSDKQQ
jgi:hypothetical protein